MRIITLASIKKYEKDLCLKEKAPATIQKYVSMVKAFADFLKGKEFTKESLIRYREYLVTVKKAQTVNIALTAINAYADFRGWQGVRVKYLKTQRNHFLETRREMSREDYMRLLEVAHKRSERLYLLLMTLGSTGIRVSELAFITAQAVQNRRAEIHLKGKYRTILLPRKLCKQLLAYCRKNNIHEGYIFRTRNGNAMDRSNVWHSLKTLCGEAGVEKTKVFPHNFRHLFARIFYSIEKNLAHLADVLGHSSLETTRIYVAVSTEAHYQILNKMKLTI